MNIFSKRSTSIIGFIFATFIIILLLLQNLKVYIPLSPNFTSGSYATIVAPTTTTKTKETTTTMIFFDQVLKERSELLKTGCSKQKVKEFSSWSYIISVPEKQLYWCQIDKSASSTMAIFLFNTTQTLDTKQKEEMLIKFRNKKVKRRQLIEKYSHRFTGHTMYNEFMKKSLARGFIIVRHPFER